MSINSQRDCQSAPEAQGSELATQTIARHLPRAGHPPAASSCTLISCRTVFAVAHGSRQKPDTPCCTRVRPRRASAWDRPSTSSKQLHPSPRLCVVGVCCRGAGTGKTFTWLHQDVARVGICLEQAVHQQHVAVGCGHALQDALLAALPLPLADAVDLHTRVHWLETTAVRCAEHRRLCCGEAGRQKPHMPCVSRGGWG